MIYRLTHATTYLYSGAVSLSHHILRLRPRDLPRQHCINNELLIEPRPDVIAAHHDYFGNAMTFITMEGSHKRLVISSRSDVEVKAPALPSPDKTPPWETAHDAGPNGDAETFLQTREFVHSSPMIKKHDDFRDYAAHSFSAGRPILDGVMDLMARMHADFKFDPEATTIATPLLDVFQTRRGVCQDFAQLQIGFLRSIGIAARYVSGYLETEPPPGKPRLEGADASHAWVSFHCPGNGWIDIDPTNNLLVADRHITLGWGRDYGDVSPIRGIIIGSGEHSMEVAVDVIPMPESSSFDSALLSNRREDSALPKS